ncbi:hypothetical protein [Lentzea pudingi]|nr:hypothetical protein [Lentzea pudingi]
MAGSSIGGLTGGKRANGVAHTWTVYDLLPPDSGYQRLEGADAPRPRAAFARP